jgi:hydroxymethylbilane synthase
MSVLLTSFSNLETVMKNEIVIGTRGSKLAIYQADSVEQAIRSRYPGITVKKSIIKTKGDKILDVALSKIGDKGLFTKELETELIKKNIDIAVHSLKDLPTKFPGGLALGGVLSRGEFRDALVHIDGKKFSQLDENDIIATSSLRRRAQLLMHNPSFRIIDIRGNINTRLQKMHDGHCSAMVMAAAGLQRLGLDNYISEILDHQDFIPAVGQGAIAMEVREDDYAIRELLGEVAHLPTLNAVTAERIFLRHLEGGCQIPIGCYTQTDGKRFRIEGFISNPDATVILRDYREGTPEESNQLALELANSFIKRGAQKILEEIRKHNKS